MHAFLNSALDLNCQIHFAATIGHEENTLQQRTGMCDLESVWTLYRKENFVPFPICWSPTL
jgi:hypothetical protein